MPSQDEADGCRGCCGPDGEDVFVVVLFFCFTHVNVVYCGRRRETDGETREVEGDGRRRDGSS